MVSWVINLLKYPVLFLMMLLFFDLSEVLFNLILLMVANFNAYQLFFFGIAIYILLWFVLFRKYAGTDHLFMVLEHELTHLLFALLSFSKIVEIRASIHRGGDMTYLTRQGNWLTTISPYFFSLLGMILIGITYLASPSVYSLLMFFYGYVIMHHLHSVTTMLLRRQSDIEEVGGIYSILFLPSANILMLILLLTQIPADNIRLSTVFDYLYHDVFLHYLHNLFAIIG